MTKVRQPRVLDESMQEVRRLAPQTLSCTVTQLHETLPTAMVTVDEADELTGRPFVEVYGIRGSMGIFRVDAVGATYGESREYRLTHALSTLQDDVIVGQGEFTGTPGELMEMIINAQTVKRWKLGTVAATAKVKEPISYDNSNAFDSMKTLMDLLPGYTLTVEMTEYPWTVNIIKQDDTIKSEGRLSRNIASLRTDADFSEVCTRLYLDGTTRHWDADTIGTWGVISRNMAIGSEIEDDAAEDVIEAYLADKVNEYFRLHKNPTVTIEIDGFDFSKRTNQPIDSVEPGNMYRLALPDYGTAFNERVVSVAYPDMIGEPERATIQLSNRAEDASTRMAGLMVSIQKVAVKQEKMADKIATELALRVHYDDFERVNEEWMHVVSDVGIELDAVKSTLALKAERSELTETNQRLSTAQVLIDANAAAINLKAAQADVDKLGTRVSSAEAEIDGANAQIALKVSKDGVISSINQTPEEVTIKASKINLSGYVTTSKLEAKLVDVGFVDAGRLEVGQFASDYADLGQTTIGRLKLAGKTLSTTSGTFVTAVTLPTVSTDYITYMDANMDLVQQKVVTGFYQGKVTTDTISYVGALAT